MVPATNPAISRKTFAKKWLGEAVSETAKSGRSAALLTSLAVLVLAAIVTGFARGSRLTVGGVWEALWPALAAAAVVLFGFFVFHIAAIPWRWAKTDREQVEAAEAQAYKANAELFKIQQEPVTNDHRDELKAILRRVTQSVASQSPCDFGHTTDRDAVVRHFPHLTDQIEAWDRAIQGVYGRWTTLESQFKDQMTDRGLTDSPYHAELATVLMGALRDDLMRLEHPSTLRWEGPYENWLQLGNTRVVTLDEDDPVPMKERMEAAIAPVDQLFDEAHHWPAAEDFRNRDVDTGWVDLQPVFLDDLDTLLKRDHFKKGLGCERCE